MLEKELAKEIYDELVQDSKIKSFIAEVIKPFSDERFDGYDIEKLKIEAKKLGYNIFCKEELKQKIYKQEKGETLIATFFEKNDL